MLVQVPLALRPPKTAMKYKYISQHQVDITYEDDSSNRHFLLFFVVLALGIKLKHFS